jgi:hypothetical protein
MLETIVVYWDFLFAMKEEEERVKKIMRVEIVCSLIAFASLWFTGLIFYLAIIKEDKKPPPYRPNQTIVLSDTTNEWHDNFDSSFVYNGCLHLTNKKK